MADAVTTQVIHDGANLAILKFTNVSDGTGESTALKVDVSGLLGAPPKVKITRVWHATNGMGAQLLWDATANVLALAIPADDAGDLDFRPFGGINNNAGTGVTGDLLLTTAGHGAGDSYTIILQVEKS